MHRGLRPLRGLGRALLERRPDALDRVQVDGAPSEMLPMVDALNALVQRIETLLSGDFNDVAWLATLSAALRLQRSDVTKER